MTSYTNPAEIIDISDSDTDAGGSAQKTKHSARASGTQSVAPISDSILVIESSDSDDSGNLDDWGDSSDSAGFSKLLERLDLNSEPVVFSAPSTYSGPSHPTRVLAVAEANTTISLSSSDDESSPGYLAVQKENTKDTTSKSKQRYKDETNDPVFTNQGLLRQGRFVVVSAALNPSPQVVSAQTGDLSKVDAKLHRDVNKLVTDRKETIKEFTVEISCALQDLPFVAPFSETLASHDGSVEFFEPSDGAERLIRFRRRHNARYDTVLMGWIPVEAYTRLEDLYMLFLSADQLAQAVSEQSLPDMLTVLRNTHHLTVRSQVFLIIDGMNAYYKRKGAKVKRDVVESSMISLQAVEKCFIVHVDGPADTSQWLLNITGDLGIKPHKRIRGSFLPFCTDTKVRCGTSKKDTYKKMLQQIHGITESAADGIAEEVPTLRTLFEGYDKENDAHARHERLKEVTISNRKDGVAKSRILNQALSKKVHDVMWGQDPLTLVL